MVYCMFLEISSFSYRTFIWFFIYRYGYIIRSTCSVTCSI